MEVALGPGLTTIHHYRCEAAMLEVKIFLDDEDLFEGKPLGEHILRYLMHHKIKGATLFRGYMGYGSHHHLHVHGKITGSDSLPLMILFVDEEARVRQVLPELKLLVAEGLIVTQRVEPV